MFTIYHGVSVIYEVVSLWVLLDTRCIWVTYVLIHAFDIFVPLKTRISIGLVRKLRINSDYSKKIKK